MAPVNQLPVVLALLVFAPVNFLFAFSCREQFYNCCQEPMLSWLLLQELIPVDQLSEMVHAPAIKICGACGLKCIGLLCMSKGTLETVVLSSVTNWHLQQIQLSWTLDRLGVDGGLCKAVKQ